MPIADVLFGDYNPNGKLPFTYPRSPGYLTTYDANVFERVMDARKLPTFQPQFEFGHGLSYTTFEYSNLQRFVEAIVADGTVITVSVNVKNTRHACRKGNGDPLRSRRSRDADAGGKTRAPVREGRS